MENFSSYFTNPATKHHSGFRRYLSNPRLPASILNFEKIKSELSTNTLNYSDLETLLITHTDAIDNITTTKRETNRNDVGLRAKVIYERDASKAIPLAKRVPTTHITHQIDNTLLCALNTLRGIDHALTYYSTEQSDPITSHLKTKLKTAFTTLLTDIDALQEKKWCFNKTTQLKQRHKAFNSELITILHMAGLDQGAALGTDPDKFYNQLLMHYRNLATTLTPAAAVRTSTQIEGEKFTQTIDPITDKTEPQKNALAVLDTLALTNNNFHHSQPLAFQLANKAFKEKLEHENTQLGAQMRFRMPHGVKHAFIETIEYKNEKKVAVRCASTAAVAEGMTDDERQEVTTENLRQVKQFIETHYKEHANKGLEQVVLLERSKYRNTGGKINQVVMHDLMKTATHKVTETSCGFSSMPMSFYALVTQFSNPPKLSNTLKVKRRASGIQDVTARVHEIADTLQEATNQDKLVMYGCASNVNRAGAVSITLAAKHIAKHSSNSFKDAADKLAETGHETFVGTLTCPGSRGLKKASKPWTLFSSLAKQFIYGGASSSRTKTPIDKNQAEFIAHRTPVFFKPIYNKRMKKIQLIPEIKSTVLNYLSFYIEKRKSPKSKMRSSKVTATKNALETIQTLDESATEEIKAKLNQLKQKNQEAKWSCRLFTAGAGLLDELLADLDKHINQFDRYCKSNSIKLSRHQPNLTQTTPM